MNRASFLKIDIKYFLKFILSHERFANVLQINKNNRKLHSS